jgi:hypothetical protein
MMVLMVVSWLQGVGRKKQVRRDEGLLIDDEGEDVEDSGGGRSM